MAASKLTRRELDAARVITNGSTRVDSILVCNGSGSDVEVTFTDSESATILTIAVKTGDTRTWDVTFMADNGLRVDSASDANVSVTVAHSADGA